MSGFTQLDKMIGRLDLLIDMPGECVDEAAKVVEAELSKTLAAGEAPDGTAWAPRKEDGKRALKAACRKGVPDALRGVAWQRLAGADVLAAEAPGLYASLLRREPS